jgi:glutamine amidotransferase
MVAIIDYDAGNIKSVENAVRFLGHEVKVTADAGEILSADHIILPGVGAFGDAMQRLRAADLEGTIRQAVEAGKPFLGICLGLQLIFEESEESPGVKGLALLPGRIKRIPDGDGRKVPQIGWNDLSFPREGKLFRGLPENPYVYFVHSYYLQAEDESIVTATTEYGVTVHASVQKDTLFACQFHPEKSSDVGLGILKNFLSLS